MAYKRKNGKQPGVIIFFDFHESLEILAKQEGTAAVGNVVLALLDYAEHGVIPADEELTPTEQMLFKVMRSRADAAAESYKERCERNALNGQKGGLTKAMNATTDQQRKTDYLSVIMGERGVPAIMSGAAQPHGWTVAIPKQGGGMDALTDENTSIYRGQFPDLDLHETAVKWADYLNAAGEPAWPRNAVDAFENWCRKANNNG